MQHQVVSLVDSARGLSANFARDHQEIMRQLVVSAAKNQRRVLEWLAGSVLLAWAASRYFLSHRVLARLQRVSNCLRHGEPEAGFSQLPAQADDEIGDMARAVEQFLEGRRLLVETQRNLRQNEELLRAIIDAAPVAIIGLDLDGKVHTVWNHTAERMLGWSAREVMGRPLPTVPEENEAEFERFREQIRNGMTLNGVEVRRKKRDGTPTNYSIHASPLYDPEGNITGNIAVLVDIEERKQAMDALRRSKTRLQDIIDSTSDWIWEVDAKGAYTFCSGRIHSVLGYEPEEVLGRTPFDLMPPEEAERIGDVFGEFTSQKAPIVNLENWNLTKDGRRVCLLTNGVPIVDRKGRLIGYRGADQDITGRKLLENQLRSKNDDLERSNAELEQFAFVASHDLQEPLRKVGSYMELVAERYRDQLDQDACEFIDYAVDGARRMKIMIDDLLKYSRVGTRGKTFAPVDMTKVMRDVLNDLELTIKENDAAVSYDSLPVVTADDSQLQQLLRNLIGNALKYRGSDPPKVHVFAERQEQAWRFCVADNGIGIERRFLDRVFQIFQRLHARGQYEGTGIGLAVCKKIIERHGGTIGVDSAPGQGSTFYFTIPDREE
jgi:PAS domain S-box-containing protein